MDSLEDSWEAKEFETLQNTELFQIKPQILKKAEHRLNALRDAIVLELDAYKGLIPEEADIIEGHLVRGENLNGFPFRSLDMPQMFSKTEMFTFRVLFWWGHYLGFSLILKGHRLNEFAENLIQNKSIVSCNETYLSFVPTPWEWEQEKFFRIPECSEEKLRSLVKENDYLKLIRIHSVQDDSFKNLDWVKEGLDSLKSHFEIISI